MYPCIVQAPGALMQRRRSRCVQDHSRVVSLHRMELASELYSERLAESLVGGLRKSRSELSQISDGWGPWPSQLKDLWSL